VYRSEFHHHHNPCCNRVPRFSGRIALAACCVFIGIVTSQTLVVAGTLEVQFTGLNLDYDGTSIFDSGVHNTVRLGSPAQSDPLTSMSFYLDGNQVGSVLTSNIFSDIYLANILNIPAAGGVVTSGGNGDAFGIDLLSQNITPGWGLALNLDSMQLFYTGSRIAISVSGVASSLFAQSLPFGLEYDTSKPITIVVSSANLTNVTSAGGFLTGFNAAGTGNVAGTGDVTIHTPEPSTLALAAFGFIGLAAWCWRKRL
jgi:PEP-CTERM motif